jgi:hypothetical protein
MTRINILPSPNNSNRPRSTPPSSSLPSIIREYLRCTHTQSLPTILSYLETSNSME